MKKIILFNLIVVFFTLKLVAKYQTIGVEWDFQDQPQHWLFSDEQKYNGPKKYIELAEVKKMLYAKNFQSCASIALKIYPQFDELAHWIALQGIDCLTRQLNENPIWINPLLIQWFDLLSKNYNADNSNRFFMMDSGAKEWSLFLSQIVNHAKLDSKFKWRVAQYMFPLRDELSRNAKSELFKSLSDFATKNSHKDLAKSYLLKSDLTASSNMAAAPINVGAPSAASPASKFIQEPNGSKSEEEQLYLKFIEAINKAFWNQVPDYGIDYLENYPGGVKAQFISEKLINQYLSFINNGSFDQKTQINQWRMKMGKAHSDRLEDWARVLHRQGDFEGALHFALKALQRDEGSSSGAALLFIAGRCQYFLGRYDEALKNFDQLLSRHSGYGERIEVKFRRALVFIRQQKWEKADLALSEIINTSDAKSYGLSALYWLIRIREKYQTGTTDELYKLMQDKYYLTYYGLKLSSEKNNQNLSLNTIFNGGGSSSGNMNVKENFIFSELEKKAYDNSKILSAAGWYLEAQRELSQVLPVQSPQQKVLAAYIMAQNFSYPIIFSWATELFDSTPLMRNLGLLSLVFPFPFRTWIENEVKKYELSPYLIISLMRQESAFNLKAESTAQAQGLMQLIPATVQEVSQDLKMKNVTMEDMYNPQINIKFGTYYLAKVIRQFQNNVSVGLAAYNAGPQRLKRFFDGRPDLLKASDLSQADIWSDLWVEELPWLETNLYVKSILRNALVYQGLEKSNLEVMSPVWANLVSKK